MLATAVVLVLYRVGQTLGHREGTELTESPFFPSLETRGGFSFTLWGSVSGW